MAAPRPRPEADLAALEALDAIQLDPATAAVSDEAALALARAAERVSILERVGMSEAELAETVRVLSKLDCQPAEVIDHPTFRDLRYAVRVFVDSLRNRAFKGKDEKYYNLKVQRKRDRNAQQCRMRDLDKRKVNSTVLRAKRIAALSLLVEASAASEAPALALVGEEKYKKALALMPDSAAHASAAGDQADRATALPAPPAAFVETLDETDDDEYGGNDDAIANTSTLARASDAPGTERLNFAKSCYTCKGWYTELHPFYSLLCPACASLNWAKRNQRADLSGKVALLTGARVKIGFQCGLRLLQCGALVIATSRFPHDTAQRYAREPDFAEWRERLHVYGLDMRDLQAVSAFTAMVQERYTRLDIIVNNAAQTVRRPPAYYCHLLESEMAPHHSLAPAVQPLIKSLFDGATDKYRVTDSGAAAPAGRIAVLPDDAVAAPAIDATAGERDPTDIQAVLGAVHQSMLSSNRSAALSQLALVDGDERVSEAEFPKGRLDVDGQQIDLRRTNSWLMRLHEVSVPELLEVFAINALAPFIIDSKLKALMERTQPDAPKFIVNVSAMEGKFYRRKDANHPHTNMAKAALNMLTRTSAQDYANSNIFMNAVDTGWITDESPADKAARNFTDSGFVPPIDELDAAARILDPVLDGYNTGKRAFGLFLKDYVVTEW